MGRSAAVLHRALLLSLAAAVLGSAFPGAARAESDAQALRLRAAHAAADGRCAEALPLIARARALAPDDPRAALLEGQCLFQEKRYADALPAAEDAARLDPDSAPAALLLGMTHYHLGQVDRAASALERAEALAPDDAQVALYRGLVLLEQADNDAAAASFERASRIDTGGAGTAGVGPMAAYYGGLAHAAAGRDAEARAALRRVSELAPGSEWDRQAQAALAGPAPGSAPLRRWLVLQAGLDYDSNPALVADDLSNPANISSKGDGRGVWGAHAGTELFRRGDWGGGVMANYFGSAYFRERDYDEESFGAGVWIDRTLDEDTSVRLQPFVGFSLYDYDEFLRYYGVLAELFRDWGDAGSGSFYARYAWDDYRYEILGNTAAERRYRNRDGHDVQVGYDHAYPIGTGTVLQGGPFGRFYDAKGGEWDHWGVGGWLGVTQQLPWELTLDVSGSYAYDDYDNPSSFLLPGENVNDRHDHLAGARAELARPITDRITVTARYLYYNNDSNTDVFDYDRHIVGAFVTVAFGD